jgi:hypothetical protein
MRRQVYVGWDPREVPAYEVTVHSMLRHASAPIAVAPLELDQLRRLGLYTCPTEIRDGRLWDVVSEAPMSTEFAISRFFMTVLARKTNVDADWLLFCDCDFLWLGDVAQLVAGLDPTKAVACVHHDYVPAETTKMDGQIQTVFPRKNWSSMMVINARHPANEWLTTDTLNGLPGRDLHRFCWLSDDQLEALPPTWNWLEGTYPVGDTPPAAIHYTRGGPWMARWENVTYGDLWLAERQRVEDAAGHRSASYGT